MYHMLRCTNMYYHIIAQTFVYFTPLHTLYIFGDCNALNIRFWTETLTYYDFTVVI